MRNKRKIITRGVAIVLTALALSPAVGWLLARSLVVREPLAKADVIVVMSGSATFRERARHAAALFHQGRAQRVVLTNDYLQSSWSEKEQRNPYYYERSREELKLAGVPEEKITVIMVPITGTYDEVTLVKKHSETNGWHSLIVVTSAYHSRRVFWSFQHVFEGSAKSIGIDPVAPGVETPSLATWWLHRLGWEMVAKEYLKLIVYRARY